MGAAAVDDVDDGRLADFRAVADPELARARGIFIAEGRLVVRRLLRSALHVRAVLATRAAQDALADALASRPDVPVYVAAPEVLSRVAGFHIHRGCLAAGDRPPRADWRACTAAARLIVVLERVGDADNVGAIFRSAAAFGADAVLLGPSCADPLYRKAIRTSMGAALTLPFADAGAWPAALAALGAGGWAVAALTPAPDALPLRRFAAEAGGRRVALVVGHEGDGLTAPALAACAYRVRIPVDAAVDSLNVATAAAIALYEIGGATAA